MRTFTKQEKPLYRWKLTDDKRIIKHKISEWDLVPWGMGYTATRRYEFRIGTQMAVSYLPITDIDVLRHNRYYSFEDNDERVKELFLRHFISKVKVAQDELDRQMSILEEFKKNNP